MTFWPPAAFARRTVVSSQPGMVGFRLDARIAQGECDHLGTVAAVDVDDAAALRLGDKAEQGAELFVFVVKAKRRKVQIGAEDVQRDDAWPAQLGIAGPAVVVFAGDVVDDFVAHAVAARLPSSPAPAVRRVPCALLR